MVSENSKLVITKEEQLVLYRRRRALSQKDLADLLAVEQYAIAVVESGDAARILNIVNGAEEGLSDGEQAWLLRRRLRLSIVQLRERGAPLGRASIYALERNHLTKDKRVPGYIKWLTAQHKKGAKV